MPTAAAQPVLTRAQMDLGDDLRVIEYSMIRQVAQSGTGWDQGAVLDFQMFVNRNLPQLNATLRAFFPGTPARFTSLLEDGDWGRSTATALAGALAMTLDGRELTAPPIRAGQVATWYAENHAIIDSLVVGAAGATNALSTPPPVPPLAQTDREAIDQALHNSRVLPNVTATQVIAPPQPSEPIVAETIDETPPQIVETQQLTNTREIEALEVQTDFTEPDPYFESRVVAARPGSRVPWIAVLMGGGTLGGLLYWWTRRRRRRAA